MTDMTVAKTILEQLGGNRFSVMTGAKNFIGDTDSLSMRLPIRKMNGLRITLDRATDTYTMEFFKFFKFEVTTVAKLEGVYAEDLRSLFTKTTGYETSL